VDVGELDVALLNLVLNARDAMPAGGKITLSAEERTLSAGDLYLPAGGRFIVLSVADTGIGISPENIERIFEPFFTTKDRGAGTGLGLSQVYGFAKQAGGSVAVESAPGSGTTVRIVLPCASDSLTSKVPEGSGREHSFSGLNAMVVEDDPAVAKLCTGYLEDMGFKVNSFSSTSAALEALRGNAPPSIILSDILLPGKMDGVEFAHHCRRATPSSAVILMTGYGGSRFDRRQIEFPLIRKPFTGEELRALVEKSIASRTTSFA
jgi:CheY-like chemotaxis protein